MAVVGYSPRDLSSAVQNEEHRGCDVVLQADQVQVGGHACNFGISDVRTISVAYWLARN
jgi:hypothetical protein